MTPEIVPTERVRVDEVREGETVWLQGGWQEVVSIEVHPGCCYFHWGAFYTELLEFAEYVLRQAAPVSPAISWEERALSAAEASDRNGREVQRLRTVLESLRVKLDEMRLHENTGDPSDEGYMNAIRQLDEWLVALASRENTEEGS